MTCREKLKKEHPDMIDSERWGGCKGCPHMVGYMSRPAYCPYGGNEFDMLSIRARKMLCTECWNRHVPEQGPVLEHTEQKPRISNMQDLLLFVEHVMAKGDKSVSIYIRNNDMQITVYPYPEQEEESNE